MLALLLEREATLVLPDDVEASFGDRYTPVAGVDSPIGDADIVELDIEPDLAPIDPLTKQDSMLVCGTDGVFSFSGVEIELADV